MGYCDGDCKYLERDKRHSCAKYGINGTRLGYIKQTGGISYIAHEQCRLCELDKWNSKLEDKIKVVTKDLTELLNNVNNCSAYREGIVSVLNILDWSK